MAKTTVKKLAAELEKLKEEMGNVQMSSSVVWHWEQIAVEIEKHDRYGELVKVEIVHGFAVGKRSYVVHIWHYPLLQKEKRKYKGGNYYSGLEASAERYFPKKKQ